MRERDFTVCTLIHTLTFFRVVLAEKLEVCVVNIWGSVRKGIGGGYHFRCLPLRESRGVVYERARGARGGGVRACQNIEPTLVIVKSATVLDTPTASGISGASRRRLCAANEQSASLAQNPSPMRMFAACSEALLVFAVLARYRYA